MSHPMSEEPREDVALRLVFQKFERRLEAKDNAHDWGASLAKAESDLKLAISDYHAALLDAVRQEIDV